MKPWVLKFINDGRFADGGLGRGWVVYSLSKVQESIGLDPFPYNAVYFAYELPVAMKFIEHCERWNRGRLRG